MFEKNLNDFVRGLRNNKNNESKYITECLDEIKQELRQENIALKANAVLKLSYIQMLGYDITWAAFNMIEVMSSQKFTHKRIAYMTASQSFHADLDVLMLATNLIKKDMNSVNQYDAGAAMAGLSCFISPDLARDLANDIMSMMVSSKPYIRKRAILLMYKVFLNFPDALRPSFPRLKERLEDSDTGVQCAAVNVICELARKHPKNYLALAPLFFKLMTTSSNNWMLIKIIKLFGALCPLEPRLGKKLLEPLTSLIHSTSAMSLLYECINTVVAGLPDHPPSMQLCVTKLKLLIEDQDQNLKYLGLLLLNKILKSQPKLVMGHRDLILQCLDDRDESIRYRALDLIVGMITKKTLQEIVKKLLLHMSKAEGTNYRDELLLKIIEICSQSNYQFVINFEWYIDILIKLSSVEGTKHGRVIANQVLDVVVRVKAVRSYAVPVFAKLFDQPLMFIGINEKNTSCEVLFAAAWIAGEFAEYVENINDLVESFTNQRVSFLPGHIQCVIIQSLAKLFSRVLTKSEEEGDIDLINKLTEKLNNALPMFMKSSDLEVQDRSCCVMQLIKLVMKMKSEGVSCAQEVRSLFSEELLPVAAKAQKKVPIPEGLDLDKWINEPLSDNEDSDTDDGKMFFVSDDKNNISSPERYIEPDEDDIKKAKEMRKVIQESNPHYLKGEIKKKNETGIYSVDDIPIKPLHTSVPLVVSNNMKKKKRNKKGKKKGNSNESDEEVLQQTYEVAAVVDIEGGTDIPDKSDPLGMLDIDIDTPLAEHETLPVAKHRVVMSKPADVNEQVKKKKKGKSSKEEKKTKKVVHENENEKKNEKEKKNRVKSDENEQVKKNRVKKKKEKENHKESSTEKKQSEEDRKATLLAQASTYAKEVKKEGSEMDFWLFPTKLESDVVNETKETEESKIPKEKKTKKSKPKEKDTKIKKRKIQKQDVVAAAVANPPEINIIEMDEVTVDPWSHYDVLCEDKNIKLMYDVQTNRSHRNQVVASIIFKNLTSQYIKKMEFNVIDSLNMKLVRQMGASSRDPVEVPFILLPNMTNEGQFAFIVDSIVMAQWLRGTLTYITNDGESSTSEKLDFKINFPVSIHIQQQHISSIEFANLLASGELNQKQSIKTQTSAETSIDVVVQQLCLSMHLLVVEMVENGASLYGLTTQSHPLCFLVKKSNETILVDGKSTDSQLLASVIKQLKDVIERL
ncbi:AP-3 complex subunit delta-1 isoform X2 [Hydra vulgaris]|uniref:AP-3 complex subunit delta-1 isoform X2 n=1 Tax=Hydra vulgaris TaxID=6087 RepID=UPI001F5E9E5C|nr:AP-3 complex subunit delta-1 isoform X2 [Hydra vulgaris]